MDRQKFIYIFLAFFVLLTIYLYINNDKVALSITKDGLKGVLIYFMSNANYVLILISIILINREVNFIRNLVGGTILIIGMDIVSFPRMVQSAISTDLGLLASMDGLVINKLMSFGMSYQTVYTVYYLVLPLLLVFLSLQLLGINNFYKRITGK